MKQGKRNIAFGILIGISAAYIFTEILDLIVKLTMILKP